MQEEKQILIPPISSALSICSNLGLTKKNRPMYLRCLHYPNTIQFQFCRKTIVKEEKDKTAKDILVDGDQ